MKSMFKSTNCSELTELCLPGFKCPKCGPVIMLNVFPLICAIGSALKDSLSKLPAPVLCGYSSPSVA